MECKEITIKRKITISDILILCTLFIVSLSCFFCILDEGLDDNMGVLIVGVLFGILFILLCPYCTFKRPYFKVTSEGIYSKIPKGFTYGKEQFYSWDKIIENINQYNALNGLGNGLLELNDDFMNTYIYALRKFMDNIDKNMCGVITFDDYLGLE